MAAALLDASAMVAAFGAHQSAAARYHVLLRQAADERWSLSTTWPCVVEAAYLLSPPQRYTLLQWVGTGCVAVFPFAQEALQDLVPLMTRYTQEPRTEMDLADASLVAGVVDSLGAKAAVAWFDDADHAFHVRARSGRTDAQTRAAMLDAFEGWMNAL